MVQNYLSTSGTIQGVQGNDAKAPYPYWDKYAYRAVTSGELSSLVNGDFQTQALSLAPGEYTCLEISFNEPVYASQFRCYLSGHLSPIEIALAYSHLTENPDSFIVDLSNENNVLRENVYGSVRYYDRITNSTGYMEGDPVPLLSGENVQLISATYITVASGDPSSVQTGFENKEIKQIVEVGDVDTHSIRVSLKAPPAATVDLDSVSIAPIIIENEEFHFDRDTLDDDHRDELRYWYSDQGKQGHFEGEILPIDSGATITGTWTSYLTWSGVGPRDNLNLSRCTIRQTIPAKELQHLGDGLRVTLKAPPDNDVVLNHMSYMPSNSREIKLEFGSTLNTYPEDIKHAIVRWKNDGEDGDGWEAKLSRHSGHFEGAPVDVDDGSSAIMYSENVIGIPAQAHGLKAGDYVCIYGTEFYDGYYYVLTYSTPHIIVIWGIFDPEVFTSAAKIRKVVSLGPQYDDYGVKQDCRAVVPFVEVNFISGLKAYILDYTDFGKLHASVKLGPDEAPSMEVDSVYDVILDEGWLSNAPGALVTATSETGIPDTRLPKNKRFWSPRLIYDDSLAIPDIGYQGNRITSRVSDILWKGNMSCITESHDPEYEGNSTGWAGMTMFFDRRMAQPWSVLNSDALCKWVTMCYRGTIPVKFIIDMDEPRLFSKYRFWIQTVLCPDGTRIAYPKSWKIEASNHGDNNLEWDLLQHVMDYSKFSSCGDPPDSQIPGTCAEGEWESYRNLELYRYYRFHVYESWDCNREIHHYECCHIDEIDFVEHISAAGIFPTMVDTPLYIGNIEQIIPEEHIRGGSQIFYALSFDGGVSFETYSLALASWRAIVRVVGGQWQYFDGLIWRSTDQDRPEENTIRFALWYAFSIKENRMSAEDLYSLPAEVYREKMPSGGYLKFAVGLVSTGKIEATLKSITIKGTIFNPVGSEAPTEITFNNGEHGCNIPAGQTVTSDWINDDLLYQRDALFVMDVNDYSESIPVFNSYGYDMIYYYRTSVPSYDLQTVNTIDYNLAPGVVLIDHVESRQSDTITLPVTNHNLPVGAYIRVTGAFAHYDGYHYVHRERPNNIEVISKHWGTDNPIPSGAYVQRRYSIGPGNMQPHTQEGSVLEFSDTGGYFAPRSIESLAEGFYYASATAAAPLNPPANAFDPDPDLDYHSGQPISYGPVSLGVYLKEAKAYDKFRLRSSSNDYYWWRDYPAQAMVGGSNSSNPSIDNDLAWTTLWSGSLVAPIGPGRFSDWQLFSASGSYTNYRLKLLDNNGGSYDCIRFSEIDFSGPGLNKSYHTLQAVCPGFESSYLLDGSTSSEYAVITQNYFPSVALDFRNKPRELSRFRIRSAYGHLSPPATVTETFYIPASGTFPYTLPLASGTIITSITCTPEAPTSGGYKSYHPTPEIAPGQGMGGDTGVAMYGPPSNPAFIPANAYVIQMGTRITNTIPTVKFKLAHWDSSTQYDVVDFFSVSHTGNSSWVWYTAPTPHKISGTGWLPSIWTSTTRNGFWATNASYGSAWKAGDLTGDNITGWSSAGQFYAISARWAIQYRVGTDDNTTRFVASWSPTLPSEIESWSGSYTVTSGNSIKIYRPDVTTPDMGGVLKVTVVRNSISSSDYSFSWYSTYPKTLMLYGSNQDIPLLEQDTDWDALTVYTHPPVQSSYSDGGVWGDWISAPSGLDPYRHYRVKFYSNQAGGPVVTATSYINATDTFPKQIFTLPAGSTLVGVEVETASVFAGGYGETWGTIGSGSYGHSMRLTCDYYDAATYVAPHAPLPLEYNRYIMQAGMRRKGGQVCWMKFLLLKVDGENLEYDTTPYQGNADVPFNIPGNRFLCGPVSYDYDDTEGEWVTDWRYFLYGPYKHTQVGVYYFAVRGGWLFRSNPGTYLSFSEGGNSWILGNCSTWPPPNNVNGSFFYAQGARADLAVRYGNKYRIGTDGVYTEFITDMQPYALDETASWAGAYGPFPVSKDLYIDLCRPYGAQDTTGQMAVTITYTITSNEEIRIRASELELDIRDSSVKVVSPTYTDSYPVKLFDLPPWYEVTGGLVQVQTGFTGGYAEQVGHEAPGTYDNSFWTIVDRHSELQNSRAIAQIGIYSDQETTITFKLFKQLSVEWFDITDIETVTHSGGNQFQWFTLTRPCMVPDTGDQYLGWYQPNYPRKMADNTGAYSVSYQYGNYVGTNINLPLHNDMRPCLAFRYADCFSVGVDEDQEALSPIFSPALTDREWSLDQLDYSLDTRVLNIYRRCSLTQSGTQGQMKVKLYYNDLHSDSYGTLEYGIRDNGHIVYSRTAKNLVDTDRATDLFSYIELGSFSSLSFISSFYNEVRLVAFRYRPTSAFSNITNYFTPVIGLYANGTLTDPNNLVGWTRVYEDSAYTYGSAPDYWGPWVYVDSYTGSYHYYLFRLSFLGARNYPAAVGDIELLVEYNDEMWVVVPEIYNAIDEIDQEGMFDGEVTARSHPGLSRHISRILNTFSSYGQNELSPGTYFYRGENTPWTINPHPARITKKEGDLEVDVATTHPFFAGMNILAWHPLDEEYGNFMDASGNSVEAVRVGQLDYMIGRKGQGATYKDDDQVEGDIRFTLPSHLDEYTVSFWFMPKHDINYEYTTKFDIMGGWISYGAILGNWHISMSKHMMYTNDPYPGVQDNDPKTLSIVGESHKYGRMCFGNYGARIETSRDFWHFDTWYHVAFSFRARATASNPYKCWINGVMDSSSHFYSYDMGESVYPPPDVIMADPDDIHYTTHDKHNCMYFGLPLEDGPGLPYEFGLQHVMHFNKFLTDDEVFKLFRIKPPLSDGWNGVYFPDTEPVESPGAIIIDFGEPKCVTKYGLIVSSGITDNVWWQFIGSGVEGTTLLHETYDDFSTMPEYYNILNSQFFQYYVINFLGSDDKADYLFLNGFRMVDVPQIATVSGSYQTITSGIRNPGADLLHLSPQIYVPSGARVDFTVSWDQGNTWSSGIDRCELVNSGTLFTKHIFTSDPITEYPSITSIGSQQTTWSSGAPIELLIAGTLSNGEIVESGWLNYSLGQSTHHFIIFNFSPTNGNPSYSESGYGYLIDDNYTCSGSYLLSEITTRTNEVVALKTNSIAGVSPGDVVGLQGMGPYNGYWNVASGMSDDLRVYAPYQAYVTEVGAEYRRVVQEAFNIGSEIVMASGTTIVVSTDGSLMQLATDMGRQEVTAVYDTIVTEHGIQPTREIRVNEKAGKATHVIKLNLTSNTSPAPYRVFESTEDPNLYKVMDGTISGSVIVNRIAIDLGAPQVINGYRWFYGYVSTPETAPDYWEVYVTNELPYWEMADSKVGSTPTNWAWSENYDLPTVSGYRYYLFKFYEDVSLREIELLRQDISPSTDVVTTMTSTSGAWGYSNIGRLSKIEVLSDEPDTTHIFHGLTFDGGTTFKIWDEGSWLPVVRFNSVWQYYDSSWHNSSENSVYGAFREAVEEGSQMFSSTQLEEVLEANWHVAGGISSTSGTLGFIQYMYSPSLMTLTLRGYRMLYQTLPSGISGLVPSGYSYHNLGVVQDGIQVVSSVGINPNALVDRDPYTYWSSVTDISSASASLRFDFGASPKNIIAIRFRSVNQVDWWNAFPRRATWAVGVVPNPSVSNSSHWSSLAGLYLNINPPTAALSWSSWIPVQTSFQPTWQDGRHRYYRLLIDQVWKTGLTSPAAVAGIQFLILDKSYSNRTCITETLLPETEKEITYGRKLLDSMRVYMANPTTFATASGIPPTTSGVEWAATTESNNTSSYAGCSMRIIVPRGTLPSGTAVRAGFKSGGTTYPFNAKHIAIVERKGTTSSGTTTPTEITFSGTGAHGFSSIVQPNSILSDWVYYNFDGNNKDYLIIIDVGTAGFCRYCSVMASGGTYYSANSESWNVANWTGAGLSTGYNFGLYKLEVMPQSPKTSINEIAIADVQTPNDSYYLSPYTYLTAEDPVYNKKVYHYQYQERLRGVLDNAIDISCSGSRLYGAAWDAATSSNMTGIYLHGRNSGLYMTDMGFSGNVIGDTSMVQAVVTSSGGDGFVFFNPGQNTIYQRDGGTRVLTTSGMPSFSSVSGTKEYGADSFWNPHDNKIWLVKYSEEIEFWNISLNDRIWRLYYTGPSPLPRHEASIAYDKNDNCVWLFGGYFTESGTGRHVYDDFWRFDIRLKLWEELVAPDVGSRYGSAMCLDKDTNILYFYGGTDGTNYFSDTWVYDKRWNSWIDMTPIYGKPYSSASTQTTGTANTAMLYDELRKSIVLVGGNLPLNILAVQDPFELTYNFDKPSPVFGYYAMEVTDEHIYTGGILLNEGESARLQLAEVPASNKLYYAEVRLYHDQILGPPGDPPLALITAMSGSLSDVFVSNWKQYGGYISSFIWSALPLSNLTVEAHNNNIEGGGPIRINELVVLPFTYSGTWNVSDTFNLIESGHTTTVSGVQGMSQYLFQILPTPHLERLITDVDTPVPLLPGHAIGLESDFHEYGGKSQEVRAYLDSPSGIDINFMTQVSGSQTWNTYTPTWNGSFFSYLFREPENARRLKINIGNSSDTVSGTYDQIRWLRAVQLINCGDEIDFGTTGSGENTLELPTYYRDYNKISIYNNNRSRTAANARVLPRFSGNYHLDRTIRISEDTVHWGTLEDGVRFPEDYPWEMGKFENTGVSENQVFLSSTAVSGTWRSPVIEVLDPSSTAAYVYVKNIHYDQAYINEDYVSINNIMKVRSSHEKPMQLFMATAVNTDDEYGLQAPWKAVLFRSDGTAVHTLRYGIIYNEINAGALDPGTFTYDPRNPKPPRRYWATSQPYLWQFYGALDSRGFAGVTLGLQWHGGSDVEYDDYKFYQAFPSVGTYGSSWGDNESSIHIFDSNWLYLPVFNRTLREVTRVEAGVAKHSWQMVDVVYRPEPFYELYQEQYFSDKQFHARNLYKFKGDASTPEHDCEFDYLYSFEGTLDDLENDGIRCAACCDNIVPEGWGHYYWMHFSCTYSIQYFKTLLVNGTAVEKEFDNIQRKFNFMVEAGEGTPTRGFWGITQTAVFWYSYDGTSLTEEFGVTADSTSSFKRLHHGCTDYMNNLWFIDLATERVIRVNYRTKAVDYSRVVPGVSSVACDPYDNSAYLYVLRAPEFPTQDCIKLVHVGDYDYLEPETLCAVPNISVLDSFNINLIGRSTSPMGYYDVLPEDPLWGEGPDSIPWVHYSAASPTLPKGIYKQFKLTLRRSDLEAASPEIEYLRIPAPTIINKIPWKGYKDIFVDTIPRAQNYDLTAGVHTLDLLVWWTRE